MGVQLPHQAGFKLYNPVSDVCESHGYPKTSQVALGRYFSSTDWGVFLQIWKHTYNPVLVTTVLQTCLSTSLLKLLLLVLQKLLALFAPEYSTEIKHLSPAVLKPFQGMVGNHLNSLRGQVPFIVTGEKLAFPQHDSSQQHKRETIWLSYM